MEAAFRSKPFYCRVFGYHALFTDPATKGGGEKFSYSVPTYQALKGIVESIYWKPSLYYVIDEVKIMKPIRSITKGVLLPVGKGKSDRFYHTYLVDVEYQIKYHFEWNLNRSTDERDFDEVKHTQILLRSLDRGGRRDVFLGMRECVAYVERLNAEEYRKSLTAYEGQQLDFGVQFHSFKYPSEHQTDEKLIATFARTVMDNGVIQFARPEASKIRHEITNYNIRPIQADKIRTAKEEAATKEYKEGVANECTTSTA